MPLKIAILGSTGSIGTQALDVISRYPDHFRISVLTGGNNIDLLAVQARKFSPESVVISRQELGPRLRELLSGTGIKVYSGKEEIAKVTGESDAEVVLASIVGFSGLRPTVAAIKSGKRIALANKETLVVAGEIITSLAAKSGSAIIPVDSEHSAIYQCLEGENRKSVEHITLTASGGPFLNLPESDLFRVKPSDALKHPNWNMGDKVTIDSASLMNKGLEVIEAKWLFGLDPGQIRVIVHPQSVIHSMVHFNDGSVKAQLGVPDMRLPILYAFSYPSRFQSTLPRLDFRETRSLTFEEPDLKRFRNLALAFAALNEGGNKPCVLNAANEVAVNAFLKGGTGFMDMPAIIEHTLEKTKFTDCRDLGQMEETDSEARLIAQTYIDKSQH
jgi:1-deoxy-D-xylulose-5-phosphate reductoisomerase